LFYNGYTGFFLGIQRPGSECDPLPPPNNEDKNEWSYTTTPPAFTEWTGTTLPILLILQLVSFV